MYAPSSLAAVAMLLSTVTAMPNMMPRETEAALSPWVTVDEDGVPETVTPVSSTVSGTPTVVSAAPLQITGSVVTISYYDSTVTSSGTPYPAPTGDVAGAFNICHNKDGERAPWCFPTQHAMLNPGKSYYFIWDAGYFASNATIRIEGHYFNTTTGEKLDQVFESDKIQASKGFWTCNIENDFMQDRQGTNITLQINTLPSGTDNTTQTIEGPQVIIATPTRYTSTEHKTPTGPAVYIGLPTIFGFIILCLIGTCLWHRKTRRISLGNVMSRTRHGLPMGKRSRLDRKRKADERIQLMQRELEEEGGEVYRDLPQGIPRRDSDALGSLAGTPTEERFRR
ncbi:hypothetical protein DL770_000607 [Monosporascus sp. CRB-9-2]|nr:hypothetical protein DL770_000607 [Monosporascus sp. CRB-9-2]